MLLYTLLEDIDSFYIVVNQAETGTAVLDV
jgi:hypothetical protein